MKEVRKYLAEIGARGGRRSRRTLDPDTARAMVRVREARRAFRRFRTSCFWSYRPDLEPTDGIYVINADGSGETRLTNNSANDLFPVWSPDGKRIAFISDRDGNSEIYVMNADGSGQARLTNNPEYDTKPTWSSDGTWIAFSSHRDGNFEIYTIKADGTGAMRLTDDPGIDGMPSWSPMARTLHLRATAMATLKYM